MSDWLLSIYLSITVILLAAGIIQYKPDRPVPSDENKNAARRILLSWLWPIQMIIVFTRWWIATFERLWIDAQFPIPSWLEGVDNREGLINADGTPAQDVEGTPVDETDDEPGDEPQAVAALMERRHELRPRDEDVMEVLTEDQHSISGSQESPGEHHDDPVIQDTGELQAVSLNGGR